jgi:hypothetical protein
MKKYRPPDVSAAFLFLNKVGASQRVTSVISDFTTLRFCSAFFGD